jgi:hypothetical protein
VGSKATTPPARLRHETVPSPARLAPKSSPYAQTEPPGRANRTALENMLELTRLLGAHVPTAAQVGTARRGVSEPERPPEGASDLVVEAWEAECAACEQEREGVSLALFRVLYEVLVLNLAKFDLRLSRVNVMKELWTERVKECGGLGSVLAVIRAEVVDRVEEMRYPRAGALRNSGNNGDRENLEALLCFGWVWGRCRIGDRACEANRVAAFLDGPRSGGTPNIQGFILASHVEEIVGAADQARARLGEVRTGNLDAELELLQRQVGTLEMKSKALIRMERAVKEGENRFVAERNKYLGTISAPDCTPFVAWTASSAANTKNFITESRRMSDELTRRLALRDSEPNLWNWLADASAEAPLPADAGEVPSRVWHSVQESLRWAERALHESVALFGADGGSAVEHVYSDDRLRTRFEGSVHVPNEENAAARIVEQISSSLEPLRERLDERVDRAPSEWSVAMVGPPGHAASLSGGAS